MRGVTGVWGGGGGGGGGLVGGGWVDLEGSKN